MAGDASVLASRLSGMDPLVAVILEFALLLLTGAAAVAALVQARTAIDARRDAQTAKADSERARDEAAKLAREATDAFKRQAAALEKSNELKEKESRPPAWTGPNFVVGDTRSMTNSSGRTIKVVRFDVEPDESSRWVKVMGHEDGVYKYGDSFDFMSSAKFQPRPRKLTVSWHYADESSDDLSEWIVVL